MLFVTSQKACCIFAALFAANAVTSGELVECTANQIVEDHFVDTDTTKYMLCEMRNGTTLVFTENIKSFFTGDELVLDVDIGVPPPLASTTPTNIVVGSNHHNHHIKSLFNRKGEPTCKSPSCKNGKSHIKKVLDDGTRSRANRAAKQSAAGERSIIFIRMVYKGDNGSPECDESCIRANMWTGTKNIAGLFTESSYGKVSFPIDKGKIVTVQIDNTTAKQGDACPYWDIRAHGEAALVQQHPDIAISSYDHRSFFIPKSIQGCDWGGIASVGGPTSWIRDDNGPIFGHELGHNLGMHHAGIDSDNDGEKDAGITGEYGDHSGIMSNSGIHRGVNAPHRIGLGWLDESHVLKVADSCRSKQTVKLMPLQSTPASGKYSVIRIVRNSGGYYYVSHRNDQGYDEEMSTNFVNRVSIHYEPSGLADAKTYYIAGLGDGGSFSDPHTLAVTVTSISHDGATVDLCSDEAFKGNTNGNVACNDLVASCPGWAAAGYCAAGAYAAYMADNCKASCNFCDSGEGADGTGPTKVEGTTKTTTTACSDAESTANCAAWKAQGKCNSNADGTFMYEQCRKTCDQCNGQGITTTDSTICVDLSGSCSGWLNAGYCDADSQYHDYMAKNCKYSCGMCGGGGGGGTDETTKTTATTTTATATSTLTTTTKPLLCEDDHPNCGFWGNEGFCTQKLFEAYMHAVCRRTCDTCTAGDDDMHKNPPTATTTIAASVTAAKTTTAKVSSTTTISTTTEASADVLDSKSHRTCAELGWGYRYGNTEVCGESDNFPAGTTCHKKQIHAFAEDACYDMGARLCTADELNANVAKGTGCGFDSKWVWSRSACNAGFMQVKKSKQKCVAATSTADGVRCCADRVNKLGQLQGELPVDNLRTIDDTNYGDVGDHNDFLVPPELDEQIDEQIVAVSLNVERVALEGEAGSGERRLGVPTSTVLAVAALVLAIVIFLTVNVTRIMKRTAENMAAQESTNHFAERAARSQSLCNDLETGKMTVEPIDCYVVNAKRTLTLGGTLDSTSSLEEFQAERKGERRFACDDRNTTVTSIC